MRDQNRKTLCLYLDQIKSNEQALNDIQNEFNGPPDDDCIDMQQVLEDQNKINS